MQTERKPFSNKYKLINFIYKPFNHISMLFKENVTEEKSQKDQVVTASKPSKPLLT